MPVGAWERLRRTTGSGSGALVASPDGALVYRGEAEGEEPEEVGGRLARDLLEQGAGIVLEEIREVRSP